MHEGIVPVLKKYDEVLNLTESKKYNKSIQVSLDGFVFCLSRENKILSVESWQFRGIHNPIQLISRIENLVAENEWLAADTAETKLIYEASKSTIIPRPLFDANEKESLTRFNFPIEEGYSIENDTLFHAEANVLYTIPKDLLKKTSDIFSDQSKFTSHIAILIESILLQSKNQAFGQGMYVNVRKKYLDIMVVRENKLLIFNTFRYTNKDDFIYFIIFVLEQLQINPEDIELTLLGLIDKKSHLFDSTYKYIRKVRMMPLSEKYSYSYQIGEVPSHYFYTLFNSI